MGQLSVEPTRGKGLLEGFLARKRAVQADRMIEPRRKEGALLDIGCGNGPVFLLGSGFREKYGLDQTVETVDIERYAASGLSLARHDLQSDRGLPFDRERFDVVTMLAVLEHLTEGLLAPLIGEVRRVLKQRGLFIITTPAPWTDGLLRMLAALRLVSPVEIAEHKGAHGPAAIRALLIEAGFEAGNIETGYFELGMNVWARALK